MLAKRPKKPRGANCVKKPVLKLVRLRWLTHIIAGARYHYTIIDFAALWLEGEARAGDDVSEVAWALPHELEAYELTEAAHEAIAAARIALGLL